MFFNPPAPSNPVAPKFVTRSFAANIVRLSFPLSSFSRAERMPAYQLFLFDRGQVVRKIEIECADDPQAITDAQRFAVEHTVEIYCGYRLVDRLIPKEPHPRF